MRKKETFVIVGVIAAIVMMLMLTGNVLAEEVTSTAPFSFSSWFQHTFGIQQFSVVGDSRLCDQQPSQASYASPTIGPGVHWSASAASYCSSGYGLFDVFSPDWNPYKEYENNVDITCGTSGVCHIELYCCAHPQCSSDSECQSWVGQYSTCKTASCSSWNGGYKCTTDYGTETNIPYCKSSFKYCSQNVYKDCYYISGTSCVKHTYPGVTSCPASYQGATLYSSLSTCQNNICIPKTCSSLGQTCGSVSDGCSGTLNCGTCNSGYTCSSGTCVSTNPNTTSPVICGTIVTCTESSLGSCTTECPTGYVAGTSDSCGFHQCILASAGGGTGTGTGSGTGNVPSLDLNAPLFNVGGTNVTWLYLIIGLVVLIILASVLKK